MAGVINNEINDFNQLEERDSNHAEIDEADDNNMSDPEESDGKKDKSIDSVELDHDED